MKSETPHNVRLTAPEIANLWVQYQNDSMASCVYKYILNIVEDESIRPIMSYALELSERHLIKIQQYLTNDKFSIPLGFTDDDIDLTAPRLFSDEICLSYTYIMAVNGLAGYAAAITTNVRRDLRDYYVQCENETIELFNNSLDLLIEKGIVSRPPYIDPSITPDFIEKESFMEGLLGGNRPLTCIEISLVYWDLRKIQLSKSITMAFAQVAKVQDVKDYFWRGVELYTKHIEIFESILAINHLSKPKSDESEITNSTTAPFSDRLMMYHKLLFSSTTIGLYGVAIGTAQRNDLAIHFTRLLTEIGKYAGEGFKIMLNNKWAEQPPLANDRQALAAQR